MKTDGTEMSNTQNCQYTPSLHSVGGVYWVVCAWCEESKGYGNPETFCKAVMQASKGEALFCSDECREQWITGGPPGEQIPPEENIPPEEQIPAEENIPAEEQIPPEEKESDVYI